jgi:RNA polymerase sigma factor (sigma-70 family)
MNENRTAVDDLGQRNDAALLAAQDDPGETFAVFYRRHVEVVLRVCARRGLDAAAAGDVTAETFAAALLHRRRFRPESGAARAWLLGIAAHKIADHERRSRREDRARRRLGLEAIPLTERDHADFAEYASTPQGGVDEALGALPGDQREAVLARVIEGEDYASISRRLDISESAVRQRVSRGLAALRVRLMEEER